MAAVTPWEFKVQYEVSLFDDGHIDEPVQLVEVIKTYRIVPTLAGAELNLTLEEVDGGES
jgi:hypothetical protein